jgi:TPP-dependent indolepyruvate ferredoxin oxidoreductase alpha subunit
VQDILDMGLHAFALSRFAGVWSGMKTIQEVVESAASVSVDPERVRIVLPDGLRTCRPAACTSAGPTPRWSRKRGSWTTSGTRRWPTCAPTG